MAMIFCRECGKSISDKAKKCPHCGAPSKAASSLFSLPKVLLYILIIGVAWFVVMAIQIESKPTAESKGTRACNSEEAKEKAIQMSEKTLLGKLGAKIITFRSVDPPLKDGEKLICKAVAVMSTGGDADYIIKTELINGKQMMTIAPDDGSYDNLPKADIPQEAMPKEAAPTPVTTAAPPPIEQPAPTPSAEPESTLREEPTDKPGWCYKAETTNEKLICDTPSLYALASRLEIHWTGYRLTRTPDEVANMKGMLREWNSEVLQKCDGVDAIETAYNTLLNGIPASTESRYSIANGEPYKSVREKLITAGWKPYISPDAEPCTGSTETCEGRYPETESCAGTGLGQCRFAWERAGRLVSIYTIGDNHVFEGMEEKKLPEKVQTVSDIDGWWGFTKEGCNDTDNKYRVALGKWERTDKGIEFGKGSNDSIGMYDGGCDLFGKSTKLGTISYEAKCEFEHEKSGGVAKITFTDKDNITLIVPSMNPLSLVRCNKS